MAELTKYSANAVVQHIRHDMRFIMPGKSYGNESIDTTLSPLNYSLVDRGHTAKEINQYRLNLEKEIFHYNRKDLVHAVEIVIQKPNDCPHEQERLFFEESYKYVVSKLPMGEHCVIVAEIHKDEHKYVNGIDISKPHIHILYVPAVPDDKHEGFKYKLCADALTKKSNLKEFHPGLQKHLNDVGIQATVFSKKTTDGKTISLSVKQLKEITDKTGIVLNKSITIDQLSSILKENNEIKLYDRKLEQKIIQYETQIHTLSIQNISLKNSLDAAQQQIKDLQNELSKSKQHEWGQSTTWGNAHGWDFNKEGEKLW